KDTLVAIYSRMVNAGEPLSEVLRQGFPWCSDDADGIRAIFAEYTRRKRDQNVLDYDDLLLFWRALGLSPNAAEVARRFDHILVDEYQDTNPLQAQILHSLYHRQPPLARPEPSLDSPSPPLARPQPSLDHHQSPGSSVA